MQHRTRKPPTGFSLLELIVTAAMMATLVTAVSVVLRSSQEAWEAHDSDHMRLEAAHATLRHLTRNLRQAEQIVAISASSDTSGSISAQLPNGNTVVWDHNGTDVRFGVTNATSLLASNIDELSFVGYLADAVTTSSDPSEVQLVQCTVKVTLPRQANSAQTIRCWAWLRSW